jgi:hypothetical protein
MQATGHITVVQEQRFRLMTDEGAGLLLTLSHKARASQANLCHYQATNVRVRVTYEGEPNMTSGIARAVGRA